MTDIIGKDTHGGLMTVIMGKETHSGCQMTDVTDK